MDEASPEKSLHVAPWVVAGDVPALCDLVMWAGVGTEASASRSGSGGGGGGIHDKGQRSGGGNISKPKSGK